MTIEAVLAADRGSIVAPAGCGKTHLIAEALAPVPPKPILVLTHTTAGVVALKQRLQRRTVPAAHYSITTLDGWAMRIARCFPGNCPIQASPEQGNAFYPELRQVVLSLLNTGQLNDLLRASYSRVLVDEYQDCNWDQHRLVQALNAALPTVVFGDPLQCIFNFGGPMPHWSDVEAHFPRLASLGDPWRWNNAQTPGLGDWILRVRQALLAGEQIDLRTCPAHVDYRPLTGQAAIDQPNQRQAHYDLLRFHPQESVLILGDSRAPTSRHRFAQMVNGLDVVEPVELRDVVRTAAALDAADGIERVRILVESVSTMMTLVETTQTLKRLQTIMAGRAKRAPSPVEQALVDLAQQGSRESLLTALEALESKPGTRLYRTTAFSTLKTAVSLAAANPSQSLSDSAAGVRERRRQRGDRRIPHRAIGSTLLLKGLECDHVLILDTHAMNAQHLYVALSRGSRSITVFARSHLIGG